MEKCSLILVVKNTGSVFIWRMYYTYITTNHTRNVLYIGMTNNLQRRIGEHYSNRGNPNTFAGKYFCYKLIYYEMFSTPLKAIHREKEIKKLNRKEKFDLIKSKNPLLGFLL